MATEARAGHFDPVTWRLLYAVLVPPVAWLARITAAYALVPYACAAQSDRWLHVVTGGAAHA
jgi:hypothetical protein